MVSEIFKDGPTDHGRTNGQGRLLRTPSGKPGVQNRFDQRRLAINERKYERPGNINGIYEGQQ